MHGARTRGRRPPLLIPAAPARARALARPPTRPRPPLLPPQATFALEKEIAAAKAAEHAAAMDAKRDAVYRADKEIAEARRSHFLARMDAAAELARQKEELHKVEMEIKVGFGARRVWGGRASTVVAQWGSSMGARRGARCVCV